MPNRFRESLRWTVLVRFITAHADVMLVQSEGFPSYRKTGDRPDLLPWDGCDPLTRQDAGPTPRKVPPLAGLPMTVDQQAGIARKLTALATP